MALSHVFPRSEVRWLREFARTGFDKHCYESLNPDLRNIQSNLLIHYLRFGRREGRRVNVRVRASAGNFSADGSRSSIIIWSEGSDRQSVELVLSATRQLSRKYNIFLVFNQDPANLDDLLDVFSGVIVCEGSGSDFFLAEALVSKISRILKPQAAIVFGESFSGRLFKLFGIPPISVLMKNPLDIAVGQLAEVVTWSQPVLVAAKWDEKEIIGDWLPFITSPVVVRSQIPIPKIARTRGGSSTRKQSDVSVVAGGEISSLGGLDVFFNVVQVATERFPELRVQGTWLLPGATKPEEEEFKNRLGHSAAGFLSPNEVRIESNRELIPNVFASADLYLSTSRQNKASYWEALAESMNVHVLRKVSESGRSLTAGELESKASRFLGAHVAGREAGQSQKLHNRRPDAPSLVDQIDRALNDAISQHVHDAKAVERIIDSDFADLRYALGVLPHNSGRKEAAWEYYQRSRRQIPNHRPVPEFNPVVYREAHNLGPREEPFLHYLEHGRPEGIWLSKVQSLDPGRSEAVTGPFVIHIHAYYQGVLEEILDNLDGLPPEATLIISAVGEVSIESARRVLASRNLTSAEVFAGENRGRNFGTLFEAARRYRWNRDTLVCHLHTKKSPHITFDAGLEEGFVFNWRKFLLGNLIGSAPGNVIPQIVNRFVEDPNLGLVFPYDPILMSIGVNGDAIRMLGKRLKVTTKAFLPDFPVGGMFWARGDILAHMANHLGYEDFPPEPIESDGTIVHATERIFPWVCEDMGYGYRVTYTEGLRR